MPEEETETPVPAAESDAEEPSEGSQEWDD